MKSGEVEGMKTSTPLLGSSSILGYSRFYKDFSCSMALSKSFAERLKGNIFLYSFRIWKSRTFSSAAFLYS